VVIVLLFLTGPLAYMPTVVLSAIVFLIGIDLIDLKGMKTLYKQERAEFKIALLTTLVVVFVGVQEGILVAMAVSLLNHVRHGYRPVNLVIVRSEEHGWDSVPVDQPKPLIPGLLVYRFTHSLYYANSHTLYSEVKNLTRKCRDSIKWFCIDASSIDDIDFSAAETIRSVYGLLEKKGIRLVFSNVPQKVEKKIERLQLSKVLGEDSFYKTVEDMEKDYIRHFPEKQ